MHTKPQLHISVIGAMVLFSITGSIAQTWEESVESDIIKGRIYRIAWDTAITAEAELCAQMSDYLKTVPHKRVYYLGIYAFQQGKIKKAQEQFQAFLETQAEENRTDPFFDLAQLWLEACAYHQEGSALPKEPPPSVEKANRLRWTSERGYLLARLGIDPAEGHRICQESFKLAKEKQAKDLDIFRKHLGYTALQTGDLEQANQMFGEIDHTQPEYVDVYGQVDFFDGTVAPLSLDFFDPAILQHRAEYFFRKAGVQAAKEANQGNVKGKYWLAVSKREIGGAQLDEAIQLLQEVEAAETDPQQTMLASIQLGACYRLKGELDLATEKWKKAADSSLPEVVKELGEIYIALNVNPDGAVQHFQESRNRLRAQNEGEDEEWFYFFSEPFRQYTWNLALANFKVKQTKAAKKALKKVYLPGEKNLLDSPAENSPRWHMLSLRRHLNLARLGRCYLDYTRYKEMYFYIYFVEMLPKPGYYPETYQLFPCLRWLDLLKEYQPKIIIKE